MPITNPGSAVTNQLTDLVMLRFLVNAPYLTVGSKKYFSDQLADKRNGVKYQFVVRDAGEVQNSLAHSGNANTVKEQKVEMSLEPWHIMVATGAVEAVTDLRWDDEVAKPNGAKLANNVVRDVVVKNFPKAANVIVGEGFQVLAEAGASLEEISSEKVFGFIDSKFQAIRTSNGQQFQPVGSPDKFYSSGLIGTFQHVEYRAQRFLPKIKIASADKSTLEGATAATLAFSNGVTTLTLTGASVAIKAGTPIAIVDSNGDSLFYACDLIGDVTNNPFYFIAAKDTAAGAAIEIANVPYDLQAKGGTRIFAQADGEDFTNSSSASPKVSDLAAVNAFITANATGTVKVTTPLDADKVYFCGQLRLDGAMEFETLNKIDASNADTKVGNVEGFTMFENRVIDLDAMTNKTRWDVITLAGIIDPRAVVNVYATA